MPEKTFLLHYVKRAWEDGVKETAIDMVFNRTICFSKLESMHDTVIDLLINRVEFGIDIHAYH
ncbi:hypothetical protein D5R81_05930 [Parashewanella spongiae]|uniref:Uncharacterized protein n=1 Tax=Parashewanella spongiae TaxID=342950 RepID=A0A3A6TQQ2_9GAMM|nr:hypothetical protein [Parashewanella spongiae]RJY18335.1 hypothetical protein D5R81_05930 [Parashewanella spongiae]